MARAHHPNRHPRTRTSLILDTHSPTNQTLTITKRSSNHITHPTASPQYTTSTPLDVITINNHKHLPHNTIYHVNNWKTATLTTKKVCRHVDRGLIPITLDRTSPEDEDTPILSIKFDINWKPVWVDETTILTSPNGKTTIDTYHTNKAPTRKKVITTPLSPIPQSRGWHPKNITFTTRPINPDLDSTPTGTNEINQHPTTNEEILLHALNGRVITKLTKTRKKKESNTIPPPRTTKHHSRKL